MMQRWVMSDEAHFEYAGNVDCHNCRYWSRENPKEIHHRPLHSERGLDAVMLDVGCCTLWYIGTWNVFS